MTQGRRESPLAVLIFTGLKARRDTRKGRRVAGVKCSAWVFPLFIKDYGSPAGQKILAA